MKVTLETIAKLVSGTISGDKSVLVHAPCTLEYGFEGGISFLSNLKYESLIYTTAATAVIVDKNFVPKQTVSASLIYVADVNIALATLLQQFNVKPIPNHHVDKLAFVADDVTLTEVSIGKFSVIESGVQIGENTIIADQVNIGPKVTIGNNCHIHSGVKIYNGCKIGNNVTIHSNAVIGSDGFGFKPDDQGIYQKIPQLGIVVIEDNVEIGACTVIDRATIGKTRIQKGVKLDNLIQIAHNVVIGENTVIAAQTGIAGSTTLGSNCMIGGQVGLAGHIHIAEGTLIQAKSGLSSDVKEKNKKWYGYPALDYTAYLRSYAIFKKLPDIVEKIKALEDKIAIFGKPKL